MAEQTIQEAVAPYLNKLGPVTITRDEISDINIRYYCEVAEDGNPTYWDEDFAKQTRFGRKIAPPQSLMTLTFAPWWSPDHVKEKMAEAVADRNTDPQDGQGPMTQEIHKRGFTTGTMVGSEMEFLEPFGPGDGRIYSQAMTTEIGGPKKTRVGEGVFVTSVTEFRTEKGDRLIGKLKSTLLWYNSDGEKKA